MRGKYDYDPIYKLYGNLLSEINLYVTNKSADKITDYGYTGIDDLAKLILLNNGCKMTADEVVFQKIMPIIPDEYNMCFIYGMIGNDVTQYYDFFTFNGTKNLVIFVEYFNIMQASDDQDSDHESPSHILKTAMGNSVYYDAIKKIVEVFYSTFEPVTSNLLTTAMASTQRWNQAIVAIHILEHFKQVDENDVSDIPLEDIRKIATGATLLQFHGIRIS